MELALISVSSVLVQGTTVVLALRLVRVSGARTAWFLISAAIFGMAARRSITLFRLLYGVSPHPFDLPFEIIGLCTSLFMLAGISFIAPIFESIRRKEGEREVMVASLKEALANVKTLSGLLPICASCKKIRDDKGYWNQIEAYIGKHTDAEFSHSICPDCRKKLYPGY